MLADVGGGAVRRWEARVRALAEREVRQREGVCVVEGIRAVLSAAEAALPFEAVLLCPERLRSPVAWSAVQALAARGVPRVELPEQRFRRLSDMDNPIGLLALVRWRPMPLAALELHLSLPAGPGGVILISEDIGDPGNLGVLLRTADAVGALAVVVAGAGTDPTHRRCLRASIGTAFRLPVALAPSGRQAVAWAGQIGLTTVATSAQAPLAHWEAVYRGPLAVVVGNEERGLRPETEAACALTVRVPMWGTATSLNVAVAAGVVLYEVRRQAGGPVGEDRWGWGMKTSRRNLDL